MVNPAVEIVVLVVVNPKVVNDVFPVLVVVLVLVVVIPAVIVVVVDVVVVVVVVVVLSPKAVLVVVAIEIIAVAVVDVDVDVDVVVDESSGTIDKVNFALSPFASSCSQGASLFMDSCVTNGDDNGDDRKTTEEASFVVDE